MAGLTLRRRATCLLAGLLACQTSTAVPMWEIEGTDNRIRLLGSVHFLREKDHPLPRVIDDAYRDADVIIMELAPDAITPDQMLRVYRELAVDPLGRQLDNLLGERAWSRAQVLAAGIGIDIESLRAYEPWFAALRITQISLLQLGFDGRYGIEQTISGRALADRKPILGLETLDEQLRALDTLPAASQELFLLQTLESAASIADDLDSILAAWKRGDVDMLGKLLLEGTEGQQDVYERLLVQRNRNWTRAIIDMTGDSRDCLVIVGALHLAGEDSLQNMLGAAGIRVRRIQ